MQALTRTTRRPRSWPPPTSWEVSSSEPSHLTPPMPKTPHLGLRLARGRRGVVGGMIDDDGGGGERLQAAPGRAEEEDGDKESRRGWHEAKAGRAALSNGGQKEKSGPHLIQNLMCARASAPPRVTDIYSLCTVYTVHTTQRTLSAHFRLIPNTLSALSLTVREVCDYVLCVCV